MIDFGQCLQIPLVLASLPASHEIYRYPTVQEPRPFVEIASCSSALTRSPNNNEDCNRESHSMIVFWGRNGNHYSPCSLEDRTCFEARGSVVPSSKLACQRLNKLLQMGIRTLSANIGFPGGPFCVGNPQNAGRVTGLGSGVAKAEPARTERHTTTVLSCIVAIKF